MRTVVRGGGDTQRGQAMVEYALVLASFFLVVMGIFDLGRAIFYHNMLSHAAREAARLGVNQARTSQEICTLAMRSTSLPDVPPNPACGPMATCETTAEGGYACTAGALKVEVARRGTPGSATDPVRVALTYAFRPITPLIGNIVGDPLPLGASSTMYVEY